MWKELTVSLAAAALAACCPLSADDSCKQPGECPDGKKECHHHHPKMMEQCVMPCTPCGNKKVMKITPVRRASDSEPGFFAIVEEYSVTTEMPVQTANQNASADGKAAAPAK